MTVTIVWVLWLVSGMVFLLSTRNPVYFSIVIIQLFLLGFKMAKRKDRKPWLGLNLRFLAVIVGLSALINAIFAHTGKTVLFHFPERWSLLGGAITLESLVYGAINGLVIGALYLLFNIFNQALTVKQITRLIPRAFHPIATMVTISLTFIPSIQQRTQEIREAQLIRGNPMKKIADWLPVLIPLLVSSLEDAFLLSESMASRGFISRTGSRSSSLNLVALIVALFSIFSGWFLNLYDYPSLLSYGLYGLAAIIILIVIIAGERQSRIKPYKQEKWLPADKIALIVFSTSTIASIVVSLGGNMFALTYNPYPMLSIPEVHWAGVILSLVPGLPLVFNRYD